ncbi:hypothetical protein FOCC_FOCC001856 [Frankliniella occidentalis]|nr:hypothetical protein FOCC_FOCC001856 [Frankliniella occidentalis]
MKAVLDVWVEVLLSFSLRRNIATIFDQSVGADTIPTIHGLRSISMAWVILGHTCIVAFKQHGVAWTGGEGAALPDHSQRRLLRGHLLHDQGANDSEADYLVGGRTMSMVPVALSLFASFISGIALLGYPAEVYVNGGQVVYNMLSYPLTGFFLAYQMLPVFRELKGLSLYEYLDRRFNRNCRFIASFLFLVSQIVWLPIVMYIPALAFEQVTKVDLHIVGPVVCLVCIYYTTVAIMMLGCIVMVALKGVVEVGGFGVVWERNVNSGRLEAPSFDLDPTTRHTFVALILGGVVRHTADLALSQSIIQRYMALPSMGACYKATAILMVCTFMLNFTACFCGFVAAAYYYDCDPITIGVVSAKDQIIPLFVLDVLSDIPGLTGMFIAGVFSAAMSSLSTGFNSIAAVALEDLATMFAAGLFLPHVNGRGAMLGALCSASLVGFIVIGAQTAIATGRIHVMPKPVSIDGCDLPPGTNFTLPHLQEHDDSDVLWLWRISYLWYQPVAITFGLLVASAAALAGWRNDLRDVDPRLLAPAVRRFMPQKAKAQSAQDDAAQMALGLLVSFLYFRTTAKLDVTKITKMTGIRSNALEFVGLLMYRFLRLTAPYLFSLGMVQVTMKWFYYNSVFEPPTMDHVNCPNYWWRNVLYINTLFPVKDMCMLWSWYLADDTQFYVLGVILLILATSSWCTTAYIAYSNEHMPAEDDPLALFDKIYDKPWTRLGPYLVGMAVGWILFKTDCKIRMSKVTVLLGWAVSFGCLLTLLYGLYGAVLDPITAAAYSSLSHTAWAMCISWIVIACSCGYGGPINRILSWTVLYPFSRVTYCAYLVHPVVIRLLSMKMDAPLHLGAYTIFILFLGMLVASYLFAFVLSLAFEAPVVTMLRLISPKRKAGVGRDQ